MMIKSGRWILVGSLVSILMMGGLGLAMGKKAAENKETAPVEKSQEKVQTEVAVEIKEGPAGTEVKTSAKVEESKELVEPKLLMEYKFDEEVVDVIFGEVEMTVEKARKRGVMGLAPTKVTEIVKVQYPKVLVTKNMVGFLDKNWQIKREIKLDDRAFPLISQKYVGVYKVGEVGDKKEVDSTQFYIFDNDGNKVIEKTFNEGRDFLVADNGNFISLRVWGGGGDYLFFYDSKGNLLNQVKPFEQGFFSYTAAEYSKSGKYVAIGFDTVFNQSGRLSGWVILFDYKGNEIWRKKLTEWSSITSQVLIAPSEEYIYTAGVFFIDNTTNKSVYYTYVFNINGNELIKRNAEYKAKFSPEGNYLVLFGDTRDKWFFEEEKQKIPTEQIIELIDIKRNKTLWIYKKPEMFITSVDISSNGEYIPASISIKKASEMKKILVFNKTGAIIFKQDYTSKSKSKFSVRIDKDGHSIYLIDGKRIQILNIPE